MARVHRVATTASGLDLGAQATLNGLVDADDNRSARHEGCDYQSKQASCNSLAQPAAAVEHALEISEGRRLTQDHAVQRSGNYAARERAQYLRISTSRLAQVGHVKDEEKPYPRSKDGGSGLAWH